VRLADDGIHIHIRQGTNLLAGATADGTVHVALLVGRLRPAWTDDHAHAITDAVTGEVRSVISSVAAAAGTPSLALVPMDCIRLHAPPAAAATAEPPLLLWTPMQPTQLVRTRLIARRQALNGHVFPRCVSLLCPMDSAVRELCSRR
jgi:hypothetical protein